MSRSMGSGEAFIFYIPTPHLVRDAILALGAALLLLFFSIPFHLGLARTSQSIQDDPSLWLILVPMFGLPILAVLRLAFQPKSWLARLEFRSDCIRLVPKPVLRWIGEPPAELAFESEAKEILLCEGSRDNSSLGFRVLLRGAGSPDLELRVPSANCLGPRQARILVEGIAAATGFPVRLIRHEDTTKGAVQEKPWIPRKPSLKLGGLAILFFAAAPFGGGLAVAYLHLDMSVVVVTGIGLSMCQILALLIYAHFLRERRKPAAIYLASTFFTFAASYAAAFVFASYLFAKP